MSQQQSWISSQTGPPASLTWKILQPVEDRIATIRTDETDVLTNIKFALDELRGHIKVRINDPTIWISTEPRDLAVFTALEPSIFALFDEILTSTSWRTEYLEELDKYVHTLNCKAWQKGYDLATG
ncbi:hypothetical protein MMC07_008548 [Pseudocyphellaria aurata]|nr:hypothetical protein [Pseudocyphellaria aurata]